MNEHIKELVRQCGGYYIDDEGEVGNVALLVGTDVEKFADLLVKECAYVAMQRDGDEPSDYNSVRSWAGIDIKKHFGVE